MSLIERREHLVTRKAVQERPSAAPAQEPVRMSFRQASNHLNPERSGYYLILLRNELRRRSLRVKPAVVN
jgi:hypothetical protein